MTIFNRSSAVPMRYLLSAGFAASSVFAMALPSIANAATYAYVNQSGEVSTVTADNATSAMMTAFHIDIHSGVMLLVSQVDQNIIGNSVRGM